MATNVALNDIIQVTTWCQQGLQASLNVGKFRVNDVVGIPTYEDLANRLATAMANVYAPWLSSTATFDGVLVRRLAPNPTPIFQSTNAKVTGANGANPLPAQIAAVITLKTRLPGVKWRGRKFIGFGDESSTDTAFAVNAAGLALMSDIADRWATVNVYGAGGNTSELVPVIADRVIPTIKEDIIGYKRRSYLVTQKRRAYLSKVNISPF